MIEWDMVAIIVVGGYGTTVIVILVITVFAWVTGYVVQKYRVKDKEKSGKGS